MLVVPMSSDLCTTQEQPILQLTVRTAVKQDKDVNGENFSGAYYTMLYKGYTVVGTLVQNTCHNYGGKPAERDVPQCHSTESVEELRLRRAKQAVYTNLTIAVQTVRNGLQY